MSIVVGSHADPEVEGLGGVTDDGNAGAAGVALCAAMQRRPVSF